MGSDLIPSPSSPWALVFAIGVVYSVHRTAAMTQRLELVGRASRAGRSVPTEWGFQMAIIVAATGADA
jgi:hypothetical protein